MRVENNLTALEGDLYFIISIVITRFILLLLEIIRKAVPLAPSDSWNMIPLGY